MNPTETELPTAGVIKRLAAMVYDSLLVFGVLFTATLPALLLSRITQVQNNEVIHELTPLAQGIVFQLYLLLVVIAFFCWFWKKNGQTLGMQAWRLQLVSRNGDTLRLSQCLLRLLGATISLLCIGLGYWWAWIDREHLTWHDRLSNTRVIVLPRKKNA